MYVGIYVKRYLPRYLQWGVFTFLGRKVFTSEGILPFHQQGYYQFWFEFSQNFVILQIW